MNRCCCSCIHIYFNVLKKYHLTHFKRERKKNQFFVYHSHKSQNDFHQHKDKYTVFSSVWLVCVSSCVCVLWKHFKHNRKHTHTLESTVCVCVNIPTRARPWQCASNVKSLAQVLPLNKFVQSSVSHNRDDYFIRGAISILFEWENKIKIVSFMVIIFHPFDIFSHTHISFDVDTKKYIIFIMFKQQPTYLLVTYIQWCMNCDAKYTLCVGIWSVFERKNVTKRQQQKNRTEKQQNVC